MKKRYAIIILLILILGGTIYFYAFKKQSANLSGTLSLNSPDKIDTSLTEGMNVLSQVLQINDDTLNNLPDSFTHGFVQPADSLIDYLTNTPWGYILKLEDGSPITSATIVGDSLYVPGGFGSRSYHCFNLKTGRQFWSIFLNDDGPSPGVLCDSMLIFNTESCTIFAINRFTGNMQWANWMGDPLLSFPVVSENKVYTSYPALNRQTGFIEDTSSKITPNHPLVCLNALNGKIIWRKWLDGDILVSPVIADSFLYATTFPGTVYKLNKYSGKIIAAIALKATSPPLIAGNKIFIAKRSDDSLKVREAIAILDISGLGFIKEFNAVEAPYLDYEIQKKSNWKKVATRLDLENGFPEEAPAMSGWKKAAKNVGQSNVSSLQLFQPSIPYLYNNQLVCLMGTKIFSVDPISEKVNWNYEFKGNCKSLGGTLATTPIICNNYLVTVSILGKVLVLNIDNGQIVYEKDINKKVRTAPVAKDGFIIVPTASGELNVINTGIKEIDGWPMFMKNSSHNISPINTPGHPLL